MSDYIPHELLIEILTRLPVKSLLRFTSVCKSWYSLITKPNFINTHLNHTISTNKTSNRTLLLRHYDKNDKREHYTLHRDDESFGKAFSELEFPFQSPIGFFRIVGSCNGLVCLCDDLFGDMETIMLWNPSIRKSVSISMPSKPKWPHMFVLGFGVCPVTRDFKVVRIVFYKGYRHPDLYNIPPEVDVYSLSSGSWRSIGSVTLPYYMVEFMWSQAFVSGAAHWVAYDPLMEGGFRNLIVSFDMCNELFHEMMLPEPLAGEHVPNLSITLLGGSLALLQYDKQIGSASCCIWVMRDYGVMESWTKLVTIDLMGSLGKIVGFRKNGDVLLSPRSNMLVSYVPKTQQITELGILGNTRSFYVDTYMETLVLLERKNE